MKRVLAIVCVAALFYSCESKPKENKTAEAGIVNAVTESSTQPTILSQEALKERGEYLVTIGACSDCHSPKLTPTDKIPPMTPDPDRFLSGHPASEKLPPMPAGAGKNGWVLFSMNNTAAVGPWGTSFSANLTPDPTGIGNWTLDNFKKALREGKYKGMDNTRQILPPMPWPHYSKMKDEDIEAIFTYLKSIKPVKNVVPAPLPPAA
ncbi:MULTISPECIES: c-type cytochrome [Rufibacter]|uniref:c-type cytochrome n=1 Tax=Rufibacter TaxID=1379908 RepID=UPI001B30D780|nr:MULTISPECIES: c-type cytochrome [Rufibacter]